MAVRTKKTSGRYRLTLVGSKKQTFINCDPLSGRILPPIKQKTVGADLPVLDLYLLEHFSSEVELKFFLKQMGYSVTEEDKLHFAYQHDGKTKYLELVYQSQHLYDFACLFQKYKQQSVVNHSTVSKIGLRKLATQKIMSEKIWKQFIDSCMIQIHELDFYKYLMQDLLMGTRVMSFITDYLIYEGKTSRGEQEAFISAKHYLMEALTAYKPIRGMIVARNNYLKMIKEQNLQQRKLQETDNLPWYLKTISPIGNAEIDYLESHPSFMSLSDPEKLAFANELLQPQYVYQKKL